jgi:ribulose-5-phosphate 4-epimerase/fuculose-1-phosphate aldolase
MATDAELQAFRDAGRTLFSFGLVRESEGNLSVFDGSTLSVTRTGSRLGALGPADLIDGSLSGELGGASGDLDVHRRLYAEQGPGAVAHAHPAGTVPEDVGGPGRHGVYVFAPSLGEAVEEIVRSARERDPNEVAG